jgi:hypothetical protein
MPYIKKEDRDRLDFFNSPKTSGELNYIFTSHILQYINVKGESYQTYNDIVGALECCKLELYRRKISPYEDKKIHENGDCY